MGECILITDKLAAYQLEPYSYAPTDRVRNETERLKLREPAMPEVRATLVQISDLHFGSTLDESLICQLIGLIREIAPQFLIVSGDVANNPTRRSMRRASRFISELTRECGIPNERLLVVPGNHDYKILGNIGLRRLSRVPFEIYFRRDWLKKGFWARALMDLGLTLNALWPWGRALRDPLEIRFSKEYGIAMFGFGSTPLFQAFGLATGKVGGDQISSLLAYVNKSKEELGAALKIAVVHHHPVPIPYVSTQLKERIQESFMVFFNAGTFLRELGRARVDIVLHGHKHFAGFTRVTYDLPDSLRHELNILAAGSASHKGRSDPLGNEFNIIRVYDDDTATAEQWYFSHEVRRKDESRGYVLYNINDVCDRRRERLIRKTGFKVRDVHKTVKLTEHGYSTINFELRGCEPLMEQGVTEFPVDLTAPGKSYIRAFEILRLPQGPAFVTFVKDTEQSHFRWLTGKLVFGETKLIGAGPFDLGYAYNLMNGHALNADEFQRKYLDQDLEWEYASVWCEVAADGVTLTLELPFDINTIDYGAEAVHLLWRSREKKPSELDWRDEKQHDEETSRIKGCLTAVDNRTLRLCVPRPIPEFGYRIRWRYLQRPSVPGATYRVREAQLKYVRSELIKAAAAISAQAEGVEILRPLDDYFVAFLHDIEERNPQCDPKEELTISLAVIDDAESALRFVATNHGSLSDLLNETFVPGEGCAGFSFEKRRVLFYDRTRDSIGYYVAPEEVVKQRGEPTSLEPNEVLFTIPWIDPSGIPVGVLSIGSTAQFSRLLRVFDLSEPEQEAEMAILLNLTKTLTEGIIRFFVNRSKGDE